LDFGFWIAEKNFILNRSKKRLKGIQVMTETEMKQRTKTFALRAIKLANTLSKDFAGRRLGDQLLRSATSVAANYRSACRARSRADFVNKLAVAEEEADESAFWMELLIESGLVPLRRLEKLLGEANELTAILVASQKTIKRGS
jgi:four helix bundle protein